MSAAWEHGKRCKCRWLALAALANATVYRHQALCIVWFPCAPNQAQAQASEAAPVYFEIFNPIVVPLSDLTRPLQVTLSASTAFGSPSVQPAFSAQVQFVNGLFLPAQPSGICWHLNKKRLDAGCRIVRLVAGRSSGSEASDFDSETRKLLKDPDLFAQLSGIFWQDLVDWSMVVYGCVGNTVCSLLVVLGPSWQRSKLMKPHTSRMNWVNKGIIII